MEKNRADYDDANRIDFINYITNIDEFLYFPFSSCEIINYMEMLDAYDNSIYPHNITMMIVSFQATKKYIKLNQNVREFR